MDTDAETASRLPDLLAGMLEHAPEQWDAFLAENCGAHPALRAELLSLAGQHTAAQEFLETPAYDLTDASPNGPAHGELKPGETLGDCEILELIGEGGMGEVYLAQDTRLGRRVAVKLLKRHLHDALGQRFRQEQRVLAGLTHPGVARLYDTAVEDGRAYLVMEYVEGERLDRFCDERRLSIGERLILFRKICAAVAYAHQNLVVHRDLKPANIRVTPEGEPKLLDFGIAKLIDPLADRDAAQTVTLDGALTPGYASPEQLRGEAVNTATDTYSLGVVLYELLCGRKPFDPHRRRTGEPGRANREEVAPRPGGGLPTAEAAASRASTPGRLVRQLRGDLDNIVLLAMRFESARRYPSVSHFSEDIRRHLEGQPVAARKETLRYVGAKFVARNKALTAAAGVVLLTLLGGIVATSWQAHVADQQRQRADRRFDDVRRLADSLMGEINDSVQTLAGSTSTQKLIVARALEYLDNLSKEADVPALRLDLAAAYEKIGNVQGNPYYANLGDTTGAMASYRKARSLLESLAVTGVAAPTAARMALGRIDRAVGDMCENTGDYAGTIRAYRASLDVFVRLAHDLPSDPVVTDELARAYGTLGDGLDRTEHGRTEQVNCFEQALAYVQKLLDGSPGNPKYQRSLAVNLQKLGRISLHDPAHGIADLTRGVAGMQALSAANPDNARARREYAVGLLFLGEAQMEVGDPPAAMPSFQKSLAIREQVAAADPNDAQAQFDLAATQSELSEAFTQTGKPEESLVYGSKAVATLVKLLATDPGSTKLVRNGGIIYKRIGNAHAALAARESSDTTTRLAHWADAQTAYEKAQKLFTGLSAQGVVRPEDGDMSEKLRGNLARCQEAITQLKK